MPPRSFVEFAPTIPNNQPEYKPVQIYVSINNALTTRKDLLSDLALGTFRVEGGSSNASRKRVKIGLLDQFEHPLLVMDYAIRGYTTAPVLSPIFKSRGERIDISIPDREKFGKVYMFWEQLCLGVIEGKTNALEFDIRQLPPGKHRFWFVAEDSFSTLLQPVYTDIAVQPRYVLKIDKMSNEIMVPKDAVNPVLNIHVNTADALSIAYTKLFMAGHYVGKSENKEFEMPSSLRDVPSGRATLELIGVSNDGVTYPPETLTLQIKNKQWELKMLYSPEYIPIQELLEQVPELEQTYASFQAKADNEPATRIEVSETVDKRGNRRTTTHAIPGRKAEYAGKAAVAQVALTQVNLSLAHRYSALEYYEMAIACYIRAIKLSSASNSTFMQAKQELKSLLEKIRR
ncbi:MAG: hypothetical protein NT023_08645 [Armatimonadetes bacterium]|nr:hypothetical protein [Armatimonadota bacterium]